MQRSLALLPAQPRKVHGHGYWRAVPQGSIGKRKRHKERVMSSDNNNGSNDGNDTNIDTRKTAMLIFRDEGVDWAQVAADGRSKELFQKLVDWAADLKRRGVYAGVEALAQSGKTVRRKGAGLVIDGPFAEGREAVLGFFLVHVNDIDEACAIAGESPHAEFGGTTDVRMLPTFPQP